MVEIFLEGLQSGALIAARPIRSAETRYILDGDCILIAQVFAYDIFPKRGRLSIVKEHSGPDGVTAPAAPEHGAITRTDLNLLMG